MSCSSPFSLPLSHLLLFFRLLLILSHLLLLIFLLFYSPPSLPLFLFFSSNYSSTCSSLSAPLAVSFIFSLFLLLFLFFRLISVLFSLLMIILHLLYFLLIFPIHIFRCILFSLASFLIIFVSLQPPPLPSLFPTPSCIIFLPDSLRLPSFPLHRFSSPLHLSHPPLPTSLLLLCDHHSSPFHHPPPFHIYSVPPPPLRSHRLICQNTQNAMCISHNQPPLNGVLIENTITLFFIS